jgi:hypothetical protein
MVDDDPGGSSAGWGRGVIASAVLGVLWPPAMLV